MDLRSWTSREESFSDFMIDLRLIERSRESTRTKEYRISELFAQGANINQQDKIGNTFLHYARHADFINLLLKCGADINIRNRKGETPLLRIIKMCNQFIDARITRTKSVIMALLNNDPDVNIKDSRGCSPLFAYLLHHDCDIEIVKRFVELGAETDVKYKKKFTLLHAAVSNRHCTIAIVRYLLAIGLDPNSANLAKKTVLHCYLSTKEFNLDIIKELIKGGADVLKEDKDEETPLMLAVKNSNCTKELLKALVCNNPTLINAKVPNYHTLLHLAARHKRNVEELVACGADVNATSDGGLTPLHFVLSPYHDKKCAEVLLKYGANVNAVTDQQFTPLHYAVLDRTCDEKIVRLLIEYGADVNATTDCGLTPLNLLLNNPSCDEQIVNVLVKHGADVNVKCFNGISLLHFAFRMTANVNVIKALLDSKADLCALDDERGSPFNYSLFNRHFSNSFLMDLLTSDVDFIQCFNLTANNRNVLLMYFDRHENVLLKTVMKYIILECYPEMSAGEGPLVLEVFFRRADSATCKIYGAFYRSCMAEIKSMRADSVSDHITFYDIMTQEFSRLTQGQSNHAKEKIIAVVLSRIASNQYPLYSDMLTYVRKKDFLKNLDTTTVYSIAKGNARQIILPQYPVRRIADYLSKQDVINLIFAYSTYSDINNN